MSPLRVLIAFGTRPEAIKLAPLVRLLGSQPRRFAVRTCVSAQHRDLLHQVLTTFELTPDHDLDLMQPDQTLPQLTARVIEGMTEVLVAERPDIVFVQGDTTTAFTAALAAFYQAIPVGHVEAGLRTGRRRSPFPEEMNRRLIGRLADLHFAPTQRAADSLAAEGVRPDSIFVTGNTGVDALLWTREAIASGRARVPEWSFLQSGRQLILVTAHRRESFGPGLEQICDALIELGSRDDVQLVYPVHPNPAVADPVRRMLSQSPGITLVDPLGYVELIDLMRRARFILTDSGGIQEEAPSLGKPVLVLRENTERPVAVEVGTAVLTGADPAKIVAEASRLLDDPAHYATMARRHSPFGDGLACQRIADVLLRCDPRTLDPA